MHAGLEDMRNIHLRRISTSLRRWKAAQHLAAQSRDGVDSGGGLVIPTQGAHRPGDVCPDVSSQRQKTHAIHVRAVRHGNGQGLTGQAAQKFHGHALQY